MAVDCVICVLWMAIISSVGVIARPSCGPDGFYDQQNCIPMTPQREEEITHIVSNISDYVDNLALKHDYFDIRLIKFAIERHSPNEPENKNMEIQVTVNDCADAVEHSNVAKTELSETSNTDLALVDPAVEDQNSLLAQSELVYLDLDETGQQFVHRIEEIRGHKPFLVLLLGDKYVFF